MRDGLTEIVIVLDRSGSMSAIAEGMQAGVDRFMGEQRLVPGECRVSLYQFDDRYEAVYERLRVADVPPCRLEPRGQTALYDALGRSIDQIGARLAATAPSERPAKVLFLIITDGQENASCEYSAVRVRDMVQHQEKKYGWQFVYLGAQASTWADAATLGIPFRNTYVYKSTPSGAFAMGSNLAAGVRSYRGGTVGMSWEASVGDSIPRNIPESDEAAGASPSDGGKP